MNDFITVNVEYLRPSRTIETVNITKGEITKVFFIYNYEGYSYRVFETFHGLTDFFQNDSECNLHFDSEVELDDFLSKIDISE